MWLYMAPDLYATLVDGRGWAPERGARCAARRLAEPVHSDQPLGSAATRPPRAGPVLRPPRPPPRLAPPATATRPTCSEVAACWATARSASASSRAAITSA